MKRNLFIVAVILIFVLSSCAHNVDVSECIDGDLLGFWHGLWHGIIAPIHLIAMLFSDEYVVFAPNNNGIWYSFGFVLGSGGWGFLGSRRKKKK